MNLDEHHAHWLDTVAAQRHEKLERFATAALAGLLSNNTLVFLPEAAARHAFGLAEAMYAESSKRFAARELRLRS